MSDIVFYLAFAMISILFAFFYLCFLVGAVYVGSAILFAVSHTQSLNALPFEPPTQAVWNEGKYKVQFKIEDGVKSAEKFLTASVEEMKMGLRAMGKSSLKELSKKI